MNRALILFSTGEIIDIKSRNALDVAMDYLYHSYGFVYDERFKYLRAKDEKGVNYYIYIEKEER